MGWLLFVVGLIVLAAVINAGIGTSLLIAGIVTIILVVYFVIRKKAAEPNAADGLRSFANVLPKIMIVISVILFLVGTILFLVGMATGQDEYSFEGEVCGVCGGDGHFFEKECKNCYGSGYEFERNVIVIDSTWTGALIAASAAVVFIASKLKE